MGCGASLASKYVTKVDLVDNEDADAAAAPGLNPQAKPSRVARDVEQAKKWSREEVEQLPIPQLCRWLQAIGTDFSPAISKGAAIQRLWQAIQENKPPALSNLQEQGHLEHWPMQEMLKWLEYFHAIDDQIVNKGQLVQMLLSHGEELPPPTFLGESAEDEFLTQVQQHVAMVKQAASTLLAQLTQDTAQVEAEERSKHPWFANAKALSAFKSPEVPGAEKLDIPFLEVEPGERLDATWHEASGWSWCVCEGSQRQGWIPATSIVEIAKVLQECAQLTEESTLVPRTGEELEVILRHYGGWTLCRRPVPAAGQGESSPEKREKEGWVPDACLSDHPRNAVTKMQRLLLSGLHRLAQDAAGLETAFYRLRTQGPSEEQASLEALYQQVLALVEEYRAICAAMQAHQTQVAERAQQKAAEAKQRSPHKEAMSKELPIWVQTGAKCFWVSKTQASKNLPVIIKKVCTQRRQVLVNFVSDANARKIVSFDAFKEMETCPLRQTKASKVAEEAGGRPKRRRRHRRQDSAAMDAVTQAQNELAEDLRGMMADLGAGDDSEHSDSDSGPNSSDSYETTSTASGSGSARSTHSARFGQGGSQPESVAAPASRTSPSSVQSSAAPASGSGSSGPSGLHADEVPPAAKPEEERKADPQAQAEKDLQGVEGLSEASDGAQEDEDEKPLQPAGEDGDESAADLEVLAALSIQSAWRQRWGYFKAVKRLAQVMCAHWLEVAAEKAAAAPNPPTAEELAQVTLLLQSAARRFQAMEQFVEAAEASKKEQKETEDAVKLWQSAARMEQARQELRALQLERIVLAATVLQSFQRGCRGRERASTQRTRIAAALALQSFQRGRRGRKEATRRRMERAAAERFGALCGTAEALQSIALIQRLCRTHYARETVTELWRREQRSARLIQALCRGVSSRKQTGPRLAEHRKVREVAAVGIASAWRGLHARRHVASVRLRRFNAALTVQCAVRQLLARRRLSARQLQKKQEAAAAAVQNAARGFLTRQKVLPQLKLRRAAASRIQGLAFIRKAQRLVLDMRKEKAARCIQGLAHIRRAKRRALELRKEKSARLFQRIARGMAGRRKFRALLTNKLVIRIQSCWRTVLGRRIAVRKRAEQVAALLDSLSRGESSTAAGKKGKTKSWLAKVNAALEWKEKRDQEDEEKELYRRRALEIRRCMHAKAEEKGLPGQLAAACAVDRSLAATRAVRVRARLRLRALLITQVKDGVGDDEDMEDPISDEDPTSSRLAKAQSQAPAKPIEALNFDDATMRALTVDEGLLARLSPYNALSELSELVRAAWAIAAACRRSPKKLSALDILERGAHVLAKRLAAEVGPPGKSAQEQEALASSKEALKQVEAQLVAEAEVRAKSIREATLGPLKGELKDALKGGQDALEALQAKLSRVGPEVEAIKQKNAAKAEAAEFKLRAEREQKHAQTVALHDLAVTTQIEKERLEAALSDRRPRLAVFRKVLSQVKLLQQQLKDLEISGTSNRKSQGILAHTLRALESRAAKAESDNRSRTVGTGKDDDLGEDDNFKPSVQVQKKQERQVEQEQQFREALESEVAALRAGLSKKASWQAQAVGAKICGEAEADYKAVMQHERRLVTWRREAAQLRQWLAEVVPVAVHTASVAAAAGHLCAVLVADEHNTEASIAAIRAVLPRLNDLAQAASRSVSADSPREGAMPTLLAKLQGARKNYVDLRHQYPDPEPRDDMDDDDENEEGDEDGEDEGDAAEQDPAQSSAAPPPMPPMPPPVGLPALGPPPRVSPTGSPREDGLPPPPGTSFSLTAGLAELGNELSALSHTLAAAGSRPPQRPPPTLTAPSAAAAAPGRPARPAATPAPMRSDKVGAPLRQQTGTLSATVARPGSRAGTETAVQGSALRAVQKARR